MIKWHWSIFVYPVIERPQGLCSSTFIHVIVVVDPLAGSCICTWNKLFKAKAISLLTYSFLKFFYDTKSYIKNNDQSSSIKKQSLKLLKYAQENVLESLFWITLQAFRTIARFIFYTHLRFLIFFMKNLKKFHQLSMYYVLLKNVKCKFMFTEAY